jgi:hypothetical protein
VIGLVRDPAQRLISAWRFFAKQTSQPDFPFSGYLQRQRRLKNYQARLYSPQLPGLADDGMLLWGQNSDRLRIGYNFFLGTVDRYDESLVIIQYLMELRNIAFAVHSKAENVSQIRESETDAVPEVPEEYIHLDKLLFRRCNQIIDSFREMIPSFENRLMAVQSQKVPTGSDDSFRHLTEPENFVRIRVAD